VCMALLRLFRILPLLHPKYELLPQNLSYHIRIVNTVFLAAHPCAAATEVTLRIGALRPKAPSPPSARETRALLEAAREYPRATLHLISLQPETAHNLPSGIAVPSAVAWLLADSPQ